MNRNTFSGASIEPVKWSEIKERVKAVNIDLYNAIETVSPSENEPLYLAQYPYGVIIDDGVFYYPNTQTGELLPLTSTDINPELKKAFTYAGNSTPLGLVLDKVVENFTIINNVVCPWAIYKPGQLFASKIRLDQENSFHPTQVMNMCSGARSLYILPNLRDAILHKKIERYFNSKMPPPHTLGDQWDIFRHIGRFETQSQSQLWKSQMLLFPKTWLHKIKNQIDWMPLHFYLLKNAWNITAFERNQRFYSVAYSQAQTNRNLKPNPYLADTAKHIFSIMAGGIPGFKVAKNDLTAPIRFLQEVYTEIHGLRGYYPHFFIPDYFTPTKTEAPVYYSLQAPTTLEFSPKARKISSTLSELWELKHIVKMFKEEMTGGNVGVEGTSMTNLLNNVHVEFFHSQSDYQGEIINTEELPTYDPNFSQLKNIKDAKFSKNGVFLRGCAQISYKH